jgi:hypothetical protein
MKRHTQASTRKAKSPGRAGSQLKKGLALIRAHPRIRPAEINRRMKLEQSDGLRATLIKRGLIRKEKDGLAVRYHIV